MDIELRDKWAKALRSGEYKQGRSRLYNKSNESYCCLGVLEAICGNPKPKASYFVKAEGLRGISMKIRKDLGIKNDLGIMTEGIYNGSLNFNQIADWIEENL